MRYENGVWRYPTNFVQTEREPLRSWEPKKKADPFPMNYFVPNFGVDTDIKATQSHIDLLEKKLKHKWTPVQDENEKWVVPTESEFYINQGDEQI